MSKAMIQSTDARRICSLSGFEQKATLTAKSGLIGARETAYGQLMRIRRQIRETSEVLAACSQ